MTLTEILSTDRVLLTCGDYLTDKGTTHCYIEQFYESAFLPYRDKSISLLEVGISGGSCLYLWKKYFSNSSRIIGVDNRPHVIGPQFLSIPGVDQYYENAYSSEFADRMPALDIVIDDGSHVMADQEKFIELYAPKLKSGGVLVIEDIYEPIAPNIRSVLEKKASDLGSDFTFKWFNLRHIKGRPDDQMIAVWRR